MFNLYIKRQNDSATKIFIHQHVTATHTNVLGSGTIDRIVSGQPADVAAASAYLAAGAERTLRVQSTCLLAYAELAKPRTRIFICRVECLESTRKLGQRAFVDDV